MEDHGVCVSCARSISTGKRSRERWASMSAEERKAAVAGMMNKWKDPEYRKSVSSRVSRQMKERWATDDPNNALVLKKLHSGRDKYFHEGPEEKLAERSQKLSESNKRYWENIDESTRTIYSKKARERWNTKSSEELARIREHARTNSINYWNSLSEEELKAHGLHSKEVWESLDDNEKQRRILFLHGNRQKYWDSKTPEERSNFMKRIRQYVDMRNIFINSNGHNKLHQQFEFMFYGSVEDLSLVPEYKTEKVTNHHWDYGVLKDDKLVAVVDLDGEFFHADKCDYDGIHSKIDYDIDRFKSVPDGVLHFTIQENNFDQCFQWIVGHIYMQYDEYVDEVFKYLRSMPMPQPQYSDIELMRSYDSLCRMDCNDKYHQEWINTRLGDRLIHHFYPSLWQDIVPLWNDDSQLRQWIYDRTIYHTHLNKNKILQALTPAYISAASIKMIINKYLKGHKLFDPLSHPNIQLAMLSMGIGCNNNSKMIEFLCRHTNLPPDSSGSTLFTILNNESEMNEILNKYQHENYFILLKESTSLETITIGHNMDSIHIERSIKIEN